MITEDYCSFELSKLLKEKGFHAPDLHGLDSSQGHLWVKVTHQMAMKWLREKHSIFIGIKYNNYYKQYKANITMMELSKSAILKKVEAMIKHALDNDFFDTYEEAVEAALKYSLENLI